MAKLSRWKQLIFGKTGGTTEFGKIGSDTVGSPENTKDPAAIQSLAGYLSGLFAITNSGVEAPRLEDLNALFYIITQQLAYIMEAGTPEWLATQEYWIGSRARIGQKVYMSLTGEGEAPNVGNNPASDAVNWRDLDAYYRDAANLLGTLPLARLPTVLTGKKASTAEVADAAIKLLTAITIGGVSFDGSANINLPGVNVAGNQNTSGNAATATKLATARNIGGVAFDGTAPINLPGVNIAGNQDTSGKAATAGVADSAAYATAAGSAATATNATSAEYAEDAAHAAVANTAGACTGDAGNGVSVVSRIAQSSGSLTVNTIASGVCFVITQDTDGDGSVVAVKADKSSIFYCEYYPTASTGTLTVSLIGASAGGTLFTFYGNSTAVKMHKVIALS